MTATTSIQRRELSFAIQTISCIACTPVFSRHLHKLGGVLEVKELPMTNKIIVVYDAGQVDKSNLKQEIEKISNRAGFGDKLIFHQ
jgi:cation transport ATPase